jgi:predicted nucleic acid-binding protein
VLLLDGLRIEHKRTYFRALDLYAATNVDFGDALSVAHMERLGITRIVSFDRDFDRLPGIERVEPPIDG